MGRRFSKHLNPSWAWFAGLVALVAALALTVSVRPANAAAITVTTTAPGVNDDAECSLQEAIYAANLDESKAPDPANLGDPDAFIGTACPAGSGDDVIALPAKATFTMAGPAADVYNYVGPTATPMVTSTLTIEANGSKIQHGGGSVAYRAFAVGTGGNLTLHEIHVKGFEVHGGDGADGGGGGMGAGGAVYVQNGRLGIGWSTFEQNGALGGDGSDGNFGAGGGGGGLGGKGGGATDGGGGGGGGARGDGADGQPGACGAICPGANEGGGGGGTYADAAGHSRGYRCGGNGGFGLLNVLTPFGRDGDDGDCAGGGGGGGQEAFAVEPIGGVFGGDGGRGNYGGGGGGGAYLLESGDGNHGGFGGGGGGGNTTESNFTGFGPSGGDGGFAGGGGAGAGGYITGGPGVAGTFGGNGSEDAGGGGGGLGGAIFGDLATIEIRNSTFVNNYARRGHSGGTGAPDGRASGGAIFLVSGSLLVNNATFNNNLTDGVGDLGGGAIAVYEPDGETASLSLRNSILAGNGEHECYLRNGASYTGANNLILDSTENGHGDTACSGVTVSDDPAFRAYGLNGGTTPTLKILITSSAADRADPVTAEPDDQRGVLRGPAPDIGAYEASDGAPVTTIALNPASPDGTHDWYKTAAGVGVSVTATDADGAVAQTRCVLDPTGVPASFADLPAGACSLTNVSSNGTHTVYAASVDTNGNEEGPPVSVTFQLDRTPPNLAPSLSGTPVLGGSGVTASPNATDAPSDVASSSCGAVDTSTPGVHTLNCTATDKAGNTGNATLTYVVAYRILGFFSPVPASKWKVGQTVPVKLALGDAAGTRISDAAAAAIASACRAKFSATGAQAQSATCMKYDPLTDQFVYTWKLGKKPTGAATITVSIGYAGTTTTTTLSETIAITS